MELKPKVILLAILVPIAYAVLVRLVFGLETMDEVVGVMTISFLFCLPTVVGILTVYMFDQDKTTSIYFRIFVPWVPVFGFLLVTLVLALEGWACWVMVLPLFLLAASVGGLIGGYLVNKREKNTLDISLLLLAPLLLSLGESTINPNLRTFEARTHIDIQASPEIIWDHVTRVAEISEDEDTGWLNKAFLPNLINNEMKFTGLLTEKIFRLSKSSTSISLSAFLISPA